MSKVFPFLENFENPQIRNKILNPNQRQLLDDTRRFDEKVNQLKQDNFGSPSHLYIRVYKEEKDINLLDKHDSFYNTTKNLLVLFQIMGIMPIMRTSSGVQGPRTTFKWISPACYWAYFIYACETIVVVWVARSRIIMFLSDSDRRFDEVIYNIIFMSLLIPHFLLPFASWRNGFEVATLKNMWTDYQLKFLRITAKPIIFPNHYIITWFLCVFSWALSIIIILSQYYLQSDFKFWHTFAYYHIIAMLNGFCSEWYVNCNAFGFVSKLFIKHLQEVMQAKQSAKKLTELRHLWIDLSHMMQQLGKAYSNMFGIYCLVIFFTTIIATYGALSEILDHGATYKEVGLFIVVFYCVSLLFIICNEAHHASRRVGSLFQNRLLNVNLTAVDIDTRKEVEMFLLAISKNPPTMNVNQFADIDRRLITSNFTFMVTYLVVLLQFKMTLHRQMMQQQMINTLKNASNLAINGGSKII